VHRHRSSQRARPHIGETPIRPGLTRWRPLATADVRTCDHRGVDPDARVCPFCGELPGAGVFCAACGRNLSDVEQLPTRRTWEGAAAESDDPPSPPASAAAGVAGFLAAMHAAGDPGATKMRRAEPGFLGRTQHVHGWVLRAASRGEPGLFLTVDGSLHRLDSVTRGIDFRGTLDMDVVGRESTEAASAAELAAVLRANGIDDAAL
jgi:hypothetical protein